MSQTTSLRFRLVVSAVAGAFLVTGFAHSPSALGRGNDKPYNESDAVREPWPHFGASYVTDYPDQLPRLVSGRAEAIPPADPVTQGVSSARIRDVLGLDYLNHLEPETKGPFNSLGGRFHGMTLGYVHSRSDVAQRLKRRNSPIPKIRLTRVNDVSVSVTRLSKGDPRAFIKRRLAPKGGWKSHLQIGRVRFFRPLPIPNDPQLNKASRRMVTAILARGSTVAEVTRWEGTSAKQRRIAARAVRVAVKTPVANIYQAHQQWLQDYAAEVSAWTMVEANNRKLPGGSDFYRWIDRFKVAQINDVSGWKPMMSSIFPVLKSVTISATASGCLEVRPTVGNGRTVHIQMDTDPDYGQSRRQYTGLATDVGYGTCPSEALGQSG